VRERERVCVRERKTMRREIECAPWEKNLIADTRREREGERKWRSE